MPENIKTEKTSDGPGRPAIADEQYWDWFSRMRPFLENGSSLWYAMEKADLLAHQTVIYEKYREGGEFTRKIDNLRALVGEYANLIAVKTLKNVHTKIVETNGDYNMTREELQIWKTVAEKHRTAQPFFANRVEEAEAKDDEFGKVVEPATITIVVPEGAETEEKPENQENAQEQNETTQTQDQLQADTETVQSVANPTQ